MMSQSTKQQSDGIVVDEKIYIIKGGKILERASVARVITAGALLFSMLFHRIF
ncbi:hypothetical protein K9O30_15655 [Clostridium bowmanii]|uniref:hypothetical protein n=1 Tax=Clostridium bowmanii TaxID=132925 RepID=UPI001C0AC0B8|nr:hypothetical protein [Clostridium bowmanii]MBU3190601.1 hypothetical protein [Clostridium bowmanii]MCA1075134.1 hypothetical protein [Clostridium bowmanii]